MSDDDQIVNLTFPARGVSRTEEAAAQPQDTAPIGRNVRVCDPATMRMRGAQRPGLSKHVATQPNGANLIQHLDVIVDPTTDALFQLTPSAGSSEADPRIPGSFVPIGGTGAQPNPNNPWALASSGDISFIQADGATHDVDGPGSVTKNFAFPSNVTLGDILLVFSTDADSASSSYLDTVTDSQGNTYTQVVGSSADEAVWWAIASATGACTVNLNYVLSFAGTLLATVVIAEYRSVHTISGVTNCVSLSETSITWTTGTITVANANSAIVGYFKAVEVIGVSDPLPSLTPGAGFTERVEEDNTLLGFKLKAALYDNLNVSANAPVTCTASASYLHTGIGICLRKA